MNECLDTLCSYLDATSLNPLQLGWNLGTVQSKPFDNQIIIGSIAAYVLPPHFESKSEITGRFLFLPWACLQREALNLRPRCVRRLVWSAECIPLCTWSLTRWAFNLCLIVLMFNPTWDDCTALSCLIFYRGEPPTRFIQN